jgi:hypothetical protein
MSQNNKSYKVRVICKDGVTFDFPSIPTICVATAVAIAEQQAMSSAKCGMITRVIAENGNVLSEENTTEIALKKEVDRLRGVVKNYIAKDGDKKYTLEDIKKTIELAREGNIGYHAQDEPVFYYSKTYQQIIDLFIKQGE